MTFLLANTFEQVADQLTGAEANAILAHYASLSAGDIVPEDDTLKFFGRLAWLERTRQIANAYTALAAHRAAWTSDASAWLAHGVSDTARRAALARGELLTPDDNTARSTARKALLWTTPSSSQTGFIQAAVLWWNSAGNPGMNGRPGGAANIANANVASFGTAAAAAVNGDYPVGHRCLRIDSWPLFVKTTLSPGGETVYYLRDGEGTGGWPGIWYTTWKAAVEATWRTWLGAFHAAGGKLDAIFLDAEFQIGRWWMQNKALYSRRLTVGSVAAGREYRVTLGSETFAVTAPDSNAQTLCNLIQLAWNTLSPSTFPNLTQMNCTHVSGTSRVLVTHKQQSLGYGVPTALTTSATGGGTFTNAIEPLSGYRYFPHPNYPAGTTWHADLKADARLTDAFIDSTYLPTRARMNDIENWPQTSGADTYRFNESVCAEFRKAIHECIYEPLAEYFPDCHLFDYEGTGKCGNVLPSSDPTSPFGAPVGTNFICGTHQSRNLYSGVNQGGNTRSDCYVPGTGTVQQSRISEVRYTPSGAATGAVYRATLAGFPSYNGALTTTDIDFTVGGTTTPLAVATGMAAAWNASVVGHVAKITATAVSTGGGNGYVKYTNDDGNQTCEEIVFTVASGTGSGTRTLQVAGAFCRILDDWWIIQGMLASSSKRLAPYILGPSNATTNSPSGNPPFCVYGPKWQKVVNLLVGMCSEYVAFWNTGSSATSDALVVEALDEAAELLEGTRAVPLVMPVRTAYDPETPLTQDFLVNGRIKRLTIDKHGDYTVRTQPTLAAIGNQTVEALSELTFTALGDSDDDLNVTYSLVGAPTGATIHATTGAFSWTPTAEQDEQTYGFKVVVADDGAVPMANGEWIEVQVTSAPNQPPTIDPIPPQNASEHTLFTLQVVADDDTRPISYSLSGAPAGMTIGGTGLITWTPNETHGGNEYTVTVIVSETGVVGEDDPPLLSSQTQFTIAVAETNTAPVLVPIAPKSGTEGTLLSFQCSATDSDIPAQMLAYSLTGSPPSGASITSGGLFTWTPGESQAGEYSVTIRVTDDGTPSPLYHERTVSITIAESNRPPVIATIPGQTGRVGELLEFTVEATDPDDDTLTYSIDDVGIVPDGLEIDPQTGMVTFTPSSEHAGQDYTITFRVTDDGSPNFSATATADVYIEANDVPPVLADPQNWVAYTGERFELQLSAEAGDLGEHTFSLIGSVVGDMAIDSASGLFSWTPRRGNEGYSYAVCVQVTTSSGLTDAVVFYVAVRRRITAQPVGPSFGPALFSGGSEGRPLRRPRRW